MLVRLLSHLFRIAIWLMKDALRLEAFQTYRCVLCGGAVREMLKGDPDIIRHISAKGGWRYEDRWTGLMDLGWQIFIFGTLDVMPFLRSWIEYMASGDLN